MVVYAREYCCERGMDPIVCLREPRVTKISGADGYYRLGYAAGALRTASPYLNGLAIAFERFVIAAQADRTGAFGNFTARLDLRDRTDFQIFAANLVENFVAAID